ncbi:MAG: hypothetical protein KGL39_19935 [Patescibacteria group bacterium]|nr:hypothetical protein [Patescibacteria group bacterium]
MIKKNIHKSWRNFPWYCVGEGTEETLHWMIHCFGKHAGGIDDNFSYEMAEQCWAIREGLA